jgi:alkylation response protein AidB-like acyl-CoA dehydrogenase
MHGHRCAKYSNTIEAVDKGITLAMATTTQTPAVRPGSPELDELLARIGEGAAERESARIAPHEQIGWIRDSGLSRLRIPLEQGGGGATVREFFETLIQEAFDSVIDGAPAAELAAAAQLATAEAKVAVDGFSYASAAKLFDAGGASATQAAHNLDRHWRNVRTISTHNPTFLKASAVGDHLVNGALFPANGYF